MKKIISIITIIIVMMFSMGAYAAPKKTNEVKFYVQINGVQMDKVGDISGRPVTNFTDYVYTTKLKFTNNKNLVLGGNVTENTILLQFKNRPETNKILDKVKETYMYKGYIKDNNGNVVSWNKMNSDNYRVQWYVLKKEYDGWHCDGRIIDLKTEQGIQMITPNNPKDIPKEAYAEEKPSKVKEYVLNKTKYTNNYAYIFGYSDTQMAPEENLLRCEIAQMIYRLVKQNDELGNFKYNKEDKHIFADATKEWFRSGIEYISYKHGFAENVYVYPYFKITRGEVFKLICLGLNITDDYELTIEDYTNILVQNKIIIGDENGNYNIDKKITRAEFCTMFNRIIGRSNAKLETSDGIEIAAKTYGFKDLKENKWYYEDMLRATSAYDNDGYIDIESRGKRNILDDYN